jgi:predicted transcriptional regulator of viral defense system
MFERVVMLLLAGEFICKVSHPPEFQFLERESERVEIDRYLSRIGRRLAQTRHQSGYYLAFVRAGEQEKESIKHHFAEVKASLTPVVMFFQLVMRTTGREELLMHGALIESSAIMAKIDQDAALRNELQTVATIYKTVATDGAHRSMFERILRKLKDNGYLTLANAERGLYQVTAKVEYLLEVVRFLQENDETLQGILNEDTTESGTLL